jgi:hypothetical protein
MLTLRVVEVLINHHAISLMDQRAVIGKGVFLDPSLSAMQAGEQSQAPAVKHSSANLVPPSTQPARTGVYFNNCEVFHDMHPSQVVYPVRYTSLVPSLPSTGKPMPRPPSLMTQRPCDDVVTAKNNLPVLDIRDRENVDHNNQGDSEDLKRKSNSMEPEPKRCRLEEKSKTLSIEQQVFVEAALALSESWIPSRKSSRKITPTTSPKSALEALPPPPFFLAANHLDLKDTSKNFSA